jgi:two-component system NtrC family sensor kinase
MDKEAYKNAKSHLLFLSLMKTLRNMPLRTRLILAFVLLIISSASATILIGYEVFNSKIDELARDTVELTAKIGTQVLNTRLEEMGLVTRNIAVRFGMKQPPLELAESAAKDTRADFVLFSPPGYGITIVRLQGGKGTVIASPDNPSSATSSVMQLLQSPLASNIRRAVHGRESMAGFVVAKLTEVRDLVPDATDDELLCMVAVASIPGGCVGLGCPAGTEGFVLTGYMLNNRTDFTAAAQSIIGGDRKERYMATLFLGERRIATTKGSSAIGTAADERVAKTVLLEGKPFSGIAKVVDRNFYAAYHPIIDLNGSSVGMVGIGFDQDIYANVMKQTITLFAGLIMAGMILGFIMTYMFSLWLVNPISQFAEGISRVAEGDLNYKVRIESADEMGKLARAFNQMVKAVKERDHKLREMTESRLTALERQVSIGRLAAGVAHEINNPLTAILSLSSLWLKHMSTEDPKREDLEIIVTETSRCREIVRNLLDFARERPMEKRIMDINKIVRETLVLAKKYDSMENVQVDLELSQMQLNVNCDPKLLQQVFTNLLLNAAEAMEHGGNIKVTTDEDSSGGFVQVIVKDSGKGISKEHLNRVFEPFFTTKGMRKGTGLGLSVSLGIVQKHDGTIEIESEEGKGTAVMVILPRVGEVKA